MATGLLVIPNFASATICWRKIQLEKSIIPDLLDNNCSECTFLLNIIVLFKSVSILILRSVIEFTFVYWKSELGGAYDEEVWPRLF